MEGTGDLRPRLQEALITKPVSQLLKRSAPNRSMTTLSTNNNSWKVNNMKDAGNPYAEINGKL